MVEGDGGGEGMSGGRRSNGWRAEEEEVVEEARVRAAAVQIKLGPAPGGLNSHGDVLRTGAANTRRIAHETKPLHLTKTNNVDLDEGRVVQPNTQGSWCAVQQEPRQRERTSAETFEFTLGPDGSKESLEIAGRRRRVRRLVIVEIVLLRRGCSLGTARVVLKGADAGLGTSRSGHSRTMYRRPTERRQAKPMC